MEVLRAGRAAASGPERDEREHELRSALFGIEASAQGLCRHRHLLTGQQFEELAAGLLGEVRRARALLEGRTDATGQVDLADAISSVVANARQAGLDVRCDVPPGITVTGRRDAVAQVVMILLDNARVHAGAPVEIRANAAGGVVTVHVEDRGPGIPHQLRLRMFERGVRGDDSHGSGLGLHIARRLMNEQVGSITYRGRHGGGASFALRFRRGRDGVRRGRAPGQVLRVAR